LYYIFLNVLIYLYREGNGTDPDQSLRDSSPLSYCALVTIDVCLSFSLFKGQLSFVSDPLFEWSVVHLPAGEAERCIYIFTLSQLIQRGFK